MVHHLRSRKAGLTVRIGFVVVAAAALLLYASVSTPEDKPSPHLRHLAEEDGSLYPKVLTDEQLNNGAIVLHFIGVLYMFVGLAIVCDEYFVPALEVITERLDVSDDVAGATFMAAGGSAPELFTSFIGVFISKSQVGFGTIVGSAVFNVLFVIGICAVFSKDVLALTWWPLFRDSAYYSVSLLTLVVCFWDFSIEWYEALLLFVLYIGYVVLMAFNEKLYKLVSACCGRKTPVVETEEVVDADDPTKTVGFIHRLHSGANVLRMPATFRVGVMQMMLTHVDPVGKGVNPDKDSRLPRLAQIVRENMRLRRMMRGMQAKSSGVASAEGGSQRQEGDKKTGVVQVAQQKQKSVEMRVVAHDDDDVDVDNEIEPASSFAAGAGHAHPVAGSGRSTGSPAKLAPLPAAQRVKEQAIGAGAGTQVGAPNGASPMAWGTNSPQLGVAASARSVKVEPASPTKQMVTIDAALGDTSSLEGADDDGEDGVDVHWPSNGTVREKVMYILLAPLSYSMWLTVPDVRKDRWRNWYPLTFIMSILWIGGFSYLMVWWATTIGIVLGIPDTVMGLTFLAAGTSIPDLLSSVIVARQGLGDMAVSSSIGSNIFDVLVGLPVPWLIAIAVRGEPVSVAARSLLFSVMVLFLMLAAVIIVIAVSKWKLTRGLGYSMFGLYVVFVALNLLVEYEVIILPAIGSSAST